MSMTRKDYIAIAEAIRTARLQQDDKVAAGKMMAALIQELIPVFKRDNPMFNADKFWDACNK